MSRLWRDRLVIGVAPDRLSALRLRGRLRPRIIDRYDHLLKLEDTSPWGQVLGAMEALLSETAWHDCDVTVILSNHYVHYAVMPKGQRLAAAEQSAFAKILFGNTFGDLSIGWELRVSPASSDMSTLASGVPHALLDALRTICNGRGWLHSIKPGLMSVFNRTRRLIGKSSGILAMVESGRITLASIEHGQWNFVVTRASDGNNLPQLLAEESELHGRNSGEMLWLCDLTGQAHPPSGSSWRHQWLDPKDLNSNADGIPSLASWGIA